MNKIKIKHLIAIAIIAPIISCLTGFHTAVFVTFFLSFLAGIIGTIARIEVVTDKNKEIEKENKRWPKRPEELQSVTLGSVIFISIMTLLCVAVPLGGYCDYSHKAIILFSFLGCVSGAITSFYCWKENSAEELEKTPCTTV